MLSSFALVNATEVALAGSHVSFLKLIAILLADIDSAKQVH
jgi:hypothetical protein